MNTSELQCSIWTNHMALDKACLYLTNCVFPISFPSPSDPLSKIHNLKSWKWILWLSENFVLLLSQQQFPMCNQTVEDKNQGHLNKCSTQKIIRQHEGWEIEHLKPRKLLVLKCPLDTSTMSQYRERFTHYKERVDSNKNNGTGRSYLLYLIPDKECLYEQILQISHIKPKVHIWTGNQNWMYRAI